VLVAALIWHIGHPPRPQAATVDEESSTQG
jgi:hypothetical protein